METKNTRAVAPIHIAIYEVKGEWKASAFSAPEPAEDFVRSLAALRPGSDPETRWRIVEAVVDAHAAGTAPIAD